MTKILSSIVILVIGLLWINSYANILSVNLSKLEANKLSINIDPFGYNNAYSDNENNTTYLIARNYDTNLGHFISQDSYNLFNRYSAFNSDPIDHIDPNGHKSKGMFHKSFWRNKNKLLQGLGDIGLIFGAITEIASGYYSYNTYLLLTGVIQLQDAALDTASDIAINSKFSKHYRGTGRISNDVISTFISTQYVGRQEYYEYRLSKLNRAYLSGEADGILGSGVFGTARLEGGEVYKSLHISERVRTRDLTAIHRIEQKVAKDVDIINGLSLNKEAGFTARVNPENPQELITPFAQHHRFSVRELFEIQKRLIEDDGLIITDLVSNNIGMYHGHVVIFDVDGISSSDEGAAQAHYNRNADILHQIWRRAVLDGDTISRMCLGLILPLNSP